MEGKLEFELITPGAVLLKTRADYVSLPGFLGEFGVLPGHAPFLSKMGSGVLFYEDGNKKERFAVHWGYAEVSDDKVSVFADLAEDSQAIDLERALEAQKKAEDRLSELEKGMATEEDAMKNFRKYEAKLLRSLTRQKVQNPGG